MKLAVLSRKARCYSTRRLCEAARKRGHAIEAVDYLRCYMLVASGKPAVFFEGRLLSGIDAVVPRIAPRYTFYGAAVVRQLEMLGVPSANSADGISCARDKLRCLQILAWRSIGLPATGFAHSAKDAEGLIGEVGGAPLVLKLLEGMRGLDVVLADSTKAAQSVIEAFRNLRAHLLVQEYVKEAGNSDLQCFVVDGRLVGAIRRQAAPGAFRAEPKYGGIAEPVELSEEERTAAVAAVGAVGLTVGSVEMLRSSRGPLVIEVNASPGFEAIEATAGVDLADAVLDYVERKVRG